MAFDGVVMRAVTQELTETLVGGRIEKIYQPTERDVDLLVRSHGKARRLHLSCHPNFPRVHLAEAQRLLGDQTPPVFCMTLRKHLEGGRIHRIQQVDMERILWIDVERRDELGDLSLKRIVIEVMGRHSNIILLDSNRETIIDSAVRVSHATSRYREVLPGRAYTAPPSQNKANPLTIDRAAFLRMATGEPVNKMLVRMFQGISPLLGREIEYRALHLEAPLVAEGPETPSPAALEVWKSFHEMMTALEQGHTRPSLYKDEQSRPTAFSAFPLYHLEQHGQGVSYESISACLEAFYSERAWRDARRQKALDLTRHLSTEIEKNKLKIEKLRAELKDAEEAEALRVCGELITAYAHQVPPGAMEVTLPDFYEEMKPRTIALDPRLSATDNAQVYFRKYRRLKKGVPFIEEQIRLAHQEISYLEGILQQIEDAEPEVLEEIREELAAGRYIRADRHKRALRKKQPKKATTPAFAVFQSSDGTQILVGRNNKQNDYLTLKHARNSDIWLHAKDIPGSHVVIRDASPDQSTLLEAAVIASFYSKARESSNVPVDYTAVKHIWKPNGAKPGFVLYEGQQTLYVTPDHTLVERLRIPR